jgi:hypothetical protein
MNKDAADKNSRSTAERFNQRLFPLFGIVAEWI